MNKNTQFAFPVPSEAISGGMTLHDWFAGQALAGLMAAAEDELPDDIPEACWKIADKMLAEREKHK